ncbi:ubiquitin-like protein Pup [bacterium]|nr:ubiquitin-like protein Pup [bacterium]
MVEKQKKSQEGKEESKKTEPDSSVTKKGEEIEDELDKLDKMIDEAIGEEEERKAQEFVEGFRQKGGE